MAAGLPLVVGGIAILGTFAALRLLTLGTEGGGRTGRGARVEVRRGAARVRLARLHLTPFTNRLVTKFGLPITG
ncbi:hypothetical protein GCM10022214_05210 [Actinomadura miaoliensis]|uniref:Uncharacterized protein n=1 Tax=Actinomadura miaoliensis TaxID=430685 RepID=A0ABP7UZX4_9ACTN